MDIESFRRLRNRTKVTFFWSKVRERLRDLDTHIDHFQNLCDSTCHPTKMFQFTRSEETEHEHESQSRIRNCIAVQNAASDLFETFENVWQCPTTKAHIACIRLNRVFPRSQGTIFDLVWNCPRREQAADSSKKLMELSVEARSETMDVNSASLQQSNLVKTIQQTLQVAESPSPGSYRDIELTNGSTSATGRSRYDIDSALPLNLRSISNLCDYLVQRRQGGSLINCAGVFNENSEYEHKICVLCSESFENPTTTSTLEDQLKLQQTKVGLFPNFDLATLLAQALPQLHSTAWLMNAWSSRDVVFFGSQNTLKSPYLSSKIPTQPSLTNQCMVSPPQELEPERPQRRKYIPDQALHALGNMLIQLALNQYCEDLEQENLDNVRASAKLLAIRVEREIGPNYAEIVRTCIEGGFGTPEEFFKEVVLKLEHCSRKCTEARWGL